VYDNAILHVDHTLDQLFGPPADGNYLKNTLVVIAADHGEAHGERGFEGHARNVYPEVTHTPWIIAFPFPAAARHRRYAAHRQRRSVADDARDPRPASDAEHRWPLARAGDPRRGARRYGAGPRAHRDRAPRHELGQRVDTSSPNIAIRDGHFRYVQFRSAEGKIREQLFDATNDAQEKKITSPMSPPSPSDCAARVESYLSSGPTFATRSRSSSTSCS
jgi:arylsulfatase A-like enzyme